MRTFKLIGAIAVVMAFSVVAVASASAEETLWRWLPGSVGETFTGSSGKLTLSIPGVAGATLICSKSTILLVDASLLEEGSTNKKDATLALAIIHLEKCTAFGVPVNSLGDSSGVILVHVEIHNCVIKAGDFGLLIKPLELHLEIPSLSNLLLLLKGSVIALLEGKEGTQQLTFGLNLKTIKGEGKEQEFLKCENGTKDELLTKIDEKEFLPTTAEVKEFKLTFDMTKDLNGEEPMIKE